MTAFAADQIVKFNDRTTKALKAQVAFMPADAEHFDSLRMTVQSVLPNGRVNVTFVGPSGFPLYRTVSSRDIVAA